MKYSAAQDPRPLLELIGWKQDQLENLTPGKVSSAAFVEYVDNAFEKFKSKLRFLDKVGEKRALTVASVSCFSLSKLFAVAVARRVKTHFAGWEARQVNTFFKLRMTAVRNAPGSSVASKRRCRSLPRKTILQRTGVW